MLKALSNGLRKVWSISIKSIIQKSPLRIMKKNVLFTALFGLSLIFGCNAQKLVPNGPTTEIGDDNYLDLISDDGRYLYFCSTDMGFDGSFGDMYITVYDKETNTVAIEHEIDEDWSFQTAYIQDDKVVLLGNLYNKKMKSVDFFQSTFPVMEKTPKKFERSAIYSIPAENGAWATRIIWSPDHSKMAFVSYTYLKNGRTKNYSIDVKVCSTDGTEIMSVRRPINGETLRWGWAYLTNDATVYLVEKHSSQPNSDDEVGMVFKSDNGYVRCLTITADGDFAPKTEADIRMDVPMTALTPEGNLWMFGKTPTGVATLELDHEGELSYSNDFEINFPKAPEGITYEEIISEDKNEFSLYPLQILFLSDGQTMVLSSQRKYNLFQNFILFLFDKNGEMTTKMLPYANLISGDYSQMNSNTLLEWDGDLWLIFNENAANYGPHKSKRWATLKGTVEGNIVMGKIDDDLKFETSVILNPSKSHFSNEYLMKVLHVSEDAVYFLKHLSGDNQIEKITK